MVLSPQPCSNDIIEECARVHHGLRLVLADAKNQSEIVDVSLLQWQQVVSDISEILLTWDSNKENLKVVLNASTSESCYPLTKVTLFCIWVVG